MNWHYQFASIPQGNNIFLLKSLGHMRDVASVIIKNKTQTNFLLLNSQLRINLKHKLK